MAPSATRTEVGSRTALQGNGSKRPSVQRITGTAAAEEECFVATSDQRLIVATASLDNIEPAAAANQSCVVAGVVEPRAGSGAARERITSSGAEEGIHSRTAGYGVVAPQHFNEVVAAVLQRNGVPTVSSRNHHIGVAGDSKV